MINTWLVVLVLVLFFWNTLAASPPPIRVPSEDSNAQSSGFDPDDSVESAMITGLVYADDEALAPTAPSTPARSSAHKGFDFVTPSPPRPDMPSIRRSLSAGSESTGVSRQLFISPPSLDPIHFGYNAIDEGFGSAHSASFSRGRSTSWAPLHSPFARPSSTSLFGSVSYSPSRMFPAQILRIPEGNPLLSPRDRAQSPVPVEFVRIFSAVSLSEDLQNPAGARVVLDPSARAEPSPAGAHQFAFSLAPPFRPVPSLVVGRLPFEVPDSPKAAVANSTGIAMVTDEHTTDSVSPRSAMRKRRASPEVVSGIEPSSPSHIFVELNSHFEDLAQIVSSDQFIQDIVSFPVASYNAAIHDPLLVKIHQLVDSMVHLAATGIKRPHITTSGTVFKSSPLSGSVSPPIFPASFLASICSNDDINTWARAIAEVFVEARNAKILDRPLMMKASPFVWSFLWFIDQLGLARNERSCFTSFVSDHEELIARFLQMDPEFVPGDQIRFVTPRLAERMVIPIFQRQSTLDADMDRLLLLIREIRNGTEEWWLTTEPTRQVDVPAIAIDSELFVQAEEMTQLIVKSLTERHEQFRTHHRFVEMKQQFRSLCQGFAGEFIRGLYLGNRAEMDVASESVGNVDPRLTRLAVQLMAVCRSAIPWTYKLDILPQLLQSGVRSVDGYRDGHVLFALPQNERMTEEFTNMMVSFHKLELMNEVMVQFSGSDAEGYPGLRRHWLTTVLRDMTEPRYGLFRVTDERRTFLKPVDYPQDDEEMKSWLNEKFRIFGRVLGIAIRYSVTPGVRFTPGALWLLSNFGETSTPPVGHVLDDLVSREDYKFFDSITEANMSSFEIGTTFGDFIPNHPNAEFVIDEVNLPEFKTSYLQQFAVTSIRDQMSQIFLGLADTIRPTVLYSFVSNDFEDLLIGSDEIDVDDLIENTSFTRNFSSKFRRWFFEILRSYDQEHLWKFLQFVSASPKPPVGGFVTGRIADRQWLHIQESPMALRDSTRSPNAYLPTVHTCFVLLELPQYTSKEIMRKQLEFAITFATNIDM